MSSMELTRVAYEVERLAKFFETIGLHPSLWKDRLTECEGAAVQKIIANNRQMVMDFNTSGSAAMAERWDCSRRTAFRKRDRAAKECQITASA
jgi:hypothetical protein